jgi:hypothetical protein
MSEIPHFLHNRFMVGGEVVSLTRWSRFTSQEDSWYSFLLEAESTRTILRQEGLCKLGRK